MSEQSGESTITIIRNNTIQVPGIMISVTSPDGRMREVDLRLMPIHVGSDPSCELSVNDRSVSAKHCELQLTAEGIRLRDRDSKNGTRIGDVRVFEAILPLGAVVTIGNSRLTARQVGAPESSVISTSRRFGRVVAESVLMRAAFAILERELARERDTRLLDCILLMGEAGTGKETLARSFHGASVRAGGPFVILDCREHPPERIDEELFGGPATPGGLIDEANGGTLFIKAVDLLPKSVQVRLARWIAQPRSRRAAGATSPPPDVRIIGTTERDLRQDVEDEAFVGDLYYRLAAVVVRVPPLRARPEDVELLVESLLAESDPPRTLADLPEGALAMLREHAWPGNVAELRSCVGSFLLGGAAVQRDLQAMLASIGPTLRLPADIMERGHPDAKDAAEAAFMKEYLHHKLRAAKGSRTKAAALAGVSREHFHRLMKEYDARDDSAR